MSSLTVYFNYYIIEIYTIYCNRTGGRGCTITPEIPRRENLIVTDDLSVINPGDSITELTLSTELSMFFAHLLKFIVFHGLGLFLTWICTISFRRTPRR